MTDNNYSAEEIEKILTGLGYKKTDNDWLREFTLQGPTYTAIVEGQQVLHKQAASHQVVLKITDLGYILSDGPEVDGDIWTGPKYLHLHFTKLVDNVEKADFEIAAEPSDVFFFKEFIELFTN